MTPLCRTVVDHLQVEGFSIVDDAQVFHGDDQAQLQDGQTCREKKRLTELSLNLSGVLKAFRFYRGAC